MIAVGPAGAGWLDSQQRAHSNTCLLSFIILHTVSMPLFYHTVCESQDRLDRSD